MTPKFLTEYGGMTGVAPTLMLIPGGSGVFFDAKNMTSVLSQLNFSMFAYIQSHMSSKQASNFRVAAVADVVGLIRLKGYIQLCIISVM